MCNSFHSAKYSASAAFQSGIAGPPSRWYAVVSSTLYDGRDAGAPYSAVVIGRSATSMPAWRKISAAKSNHVVWPVFVTWYVPHGAGRPPAAPTRNAIARARCGT